MPPKQPPSRARQAYKAIIDALVEDTQRNVCDRRVREEGIYRIAEGYDKANALVASLSQEQREALAEILIDQRKSAVSSALALLDWKLGDEISVTYQGEPIPFDQCEGGPHGDYLARCNGWKWLDDDDHAAEA
jgi:hypothetical protein